MPGAERRTSACRCRDGIHVEMLASTSRCPASSGRCRLCCRIRS
jgi:hypothetical protein